MICVKTEILTWKKKKNKPRLTQINSKRVFTWENLHRHKFHTSMAFWCCVISYLGYLKVHFMLIKYTCDSKSQTLRMRYLFQSTGRPISHGNGWWTKGKHQPSADACLKSWTRIRRPAQAGLHAVTLDFATIITSRAESDKSIHHNIIYTVW